MNDFKTLLELRNQMNKIKPSFVRQDFHKKRLRKRWVKPRGLHSKVRLKQAGHPRKVETGYGSPAKVRGLSKEGLKVVIVHNKNELERINKGEEGAIISGNVGLKNKIELLKKAKEKGIKVLNLKVDDYLKRKEEKIKKRLEKKKTKDEEKKKKTEEKKAKKKEEKLEEKLSEEEKQEKEKQEKDKLLTKREV